MAVFLAGHVKAITDITSTNSTSFGNVILRPHQFFAANQFVHSEVTNAMLFFQSTGTGKTITACYVIEKLRALYPKWTIFLLIKAALSAVPWTSSIIRFNLQDPFLFVLHFDDPGFTAKFFSRTRMIQPESRVLFLIDEAHNFIGRSLASEEGPRPIAPVYDYIRNSNKNPLNKCLLLSATPLVNSPNEVSATFNLLHAGKLPTENDFSRIFLADELVIHKPLLMQSLMGMISVFTANPIAGVFEPTDPDSNPNFAKKNISVTICEMDTPQAQIYKEAETVERAAGRGQFRTITRAACKFTFTENRKRISAFSNEDEYFLYTKKLFAGFKELVSEPLPEHIIKELAIVRPEHLVTKEAVYADIARFDFPLLKLLFASSAKYFLLCRLILGSRGKCQVFESLLQNEGLFALKLYLSCFRISFLEYSGNTSHADRIMVKQQFDAPTNKKGEEIKVMVFTRAGSEGVEYTNTTDMYFTDMSWNDATLNQAIGRGIRDSSHAEMPVDERYVNVHFLLASTLDRLSADEEMHRLVVQKSNILTELLRIYKAASVESLATHKAEINLAKAQSFFNQSFEARREIYLTKLKPLKPPEGAILTKILYTFNNVPLPRFIKVGLLDPIRSTIYLRHPDLGYIVIGTVTSPPIIKLIGTPQTMVYMATPIIVSKSYDDITIASVPRSIH